MLNKLKIIFSHGKESGPYGVKINAMTQIADELGIASESIDYRGLDDPVDRVARLVEHVSEVKEQLVLVGSSMGAYVSIKASQQLNPAALFLLAPAVYMPGYESQNMTINAEHAFVMHGLHDEIVPVGNAIRFAQEQDLELLVVDDDHVLRHSLPRICQEFKGFLELL